MGTSSTEGQSYSQSRRNRSRRWREKLKDKKYGERDLSDRRGRIREDSSCEIWGIFFVLLVRVCEKLNTDERSKRERIAWRELTQAGGRYHWINLVFGDRAKWFEEGNEIDRKVSLHRGTSLLGVGQAARKAKERGLSSGRNVLKLLVALI